MHVCCFSFKIKVQGVPEHIIDFGWYGENDDLSIICECVGIAFDCLLFPLGPGWVTNHCVDV
jgi:hypothetical protein